MMRFLGIVSLCFYVFSLNAQAAKISKPIKKNPYPQFDTLLRKIQEERGEQLFLSPQQLFPCVQTSDSAKLKLIQKAIPTYWKYLDQYNTDNLPRINLCKYYYSDTLTDFDTTTKTTILVSHQVLNYKLKDIYTADINKDGMLDWFHFPKYYSGLTRQCWCVDLFIQNQSGFEFVSIPTPISTFIDSSSQSQWIATFIPADTDLGLAFYQIFSIDKKSNQVLMKNQEVLDWKGRRPISLQPK